MTTKQIEKCGEISNKKKDFFERISKFSSFSQLPNSSTEPNVNRVGLGGGGEKLN